MGAELNGAPGRRRAAPPMNGDRRAQDRKIAGNRTAAGVRANSTKARADVGRPRRAPAETCREPPKGRPVRPEIATHLSAQIIRQSY
jgi:hypothetical protein